MILGFHVQSTSTSAVFYVYFLGFSSFTPEKKFKMQRIAFPLIQVSLSIFKLTSVNIFPNFQRRNCYDTCERFNIFTDKESRNESFPSNESFQFSRQVTLAALTSHLQWIRLNPLGD